MTTESELLQAHEQALDFMTTTIHGIKPTMWMAQSPCAEWSVRDVVNHITAENLWVEPLLDGKTIEQVGTQFDGDVIGNNPVAAWDQAAKNAATAYSNVRDMKQPVHVSWGDISAYDYLQQLTSDLIIHAWDIASGSGQDARIPSNLIDIADEILRPMVEGGFTSSVMDAPVKVPADASAQTKLLSMTGRKSE